MNYLKMNKLISLPIFIFFLLQQEQTIPFFIGYIKFELESYDKDDMFLLASFIYNLFLLVYLQSSIVLSCALTIKCGLLLMYFHRHYQVVKRE